MVRNGKTVSLADCPEFFSISSVHTACSAADRFVEESKSKFRVKFSDAQRKAILSEFILFHHFMAIESATLVIQDQESCRSCLDGMVSAVRPETLLSTKKFIDRELPVDESVFSSRQLENPCS